MDNKQTLMPCTKPFLRKVPVGNASFNALIVGVVIKPHAKNSKNITTVA
jgi:hypothetical protein